MKFSILIPVYNVELYLQQCLDSVVNQSFSAYEIIIVDDGSTDNSAKICDEYAQVYPNLITVIHKHNQGLISARRIAIEKAQGEFCIFVDSDDFIEHNLLETVDQYLNKDKNIDMVIYSYNYYTDNVKSRFPKILAQDAEIWSGDNKRFLYEMLGTCTVIDALWIKAIKTELLRKDPIEYHKYYRKNMSEDVLQSIYPLTYAKKIIYADYPLYNYRFNEDSISRNFCTTSILKKDSSHVFKELHKVLPQWGFDDEFGKKIDARWFSDVMYIFYKSCEAAKNKDDWNNIFEVDWSIMLPKLDFSIYKKYVSEHLVHIYDYYVAKKYLKIKIYFLKKKLYKKCRDLKRRFIKGKNDAK